MAEEIEAEDLAIAPKKRRALPVSNKKRMPDSQPEREIFARNIRRARIDAGITQKELAKLTGIAQAHVSDLENAQQNVCIDTIVKLAQVLRRPVHILFAP